MVYKRVEELKIDTALQKAIEQLLRRCFSEYPKGRTYYKQLPAFRYLVFEEQTLIGHMAVEHRIVRSGSQISKIFGIVDLCVDTKFQHQKIATNLIKKLTKLAQNSNVDFLILMADDHNLYINNEFSIVNATCRWLMINEHQTLGVGHRTIENCLMVRSISGKKWQAGLVDFLGPIF